MAEMIAGARNRIELPAPAPLGGGVLSVATVIDNPDPHSLMGVEAETDACATAEEWTEWCTVTPTGRKDFVDDFEWVFGDPFAVYTGVACAIQRLDDAKARAERRFTYAESRAVDKAVATLLEADALDLGGPYNINEAIGVAEAFAATIYGGVPTLLIPRQFVPCACGCGSLRPNLDGTLATCAGSRVAPLTTAIAVPAASTGTLYVTGTIVLLRGDVISISVPSQPADDGTFAPARALAERLYVPVFDCLAAKVDVVCSEPVTP